MDTSASVDWLRYFAVVAFAVAAAFFLHHSFFQRKEKAETTPEPAEPEEPDPPRDFTPAQLAKFCGVRAQDAPAFDTDGDKIYLSLKGEVFDVTAAGNFYGPGGAYHLFAGKDASRCLAKLSFDEQELNKLDLSDCSLSEKDQLDEWITKFKYHRGYPVVGRMSIPPECKDMTVDEIAEYNGTGEVPEGRVNPPIYIGVAGKVFDVSYGGFEMYKEGASYALFAGKDASRALAKMSFLPEDVNSRNVSDLTEREREVLADWAEKFEKKKLYPVVGRLA